MPGGKISVHYLPDGKSDVAADAGDYIYPADVRMNRGTDVLYIKASGIPAAFGGPSNLALRLYLQQKRQTKRVRLTQPFCRRMPGAALGSSLHELTRRHTDPHFLPIAQMKPGSSLAIAATTTVGFLPLAIIER